MHENTLEYILFDPAWATRFTAFLDEQGIPWSERRDGDAVSIYVPDDLDDAQDELIEAEYERLMDAHEAEDTSVDDMNRVGVQYHDADGELRQARVDMVLVNKVMSTLTLDELQDFVQQVADEVQAGGDKKLCQR
ncbi:MAG: hypothetical protein ACPG4N_13615 [Gammaproteobacteria bacterium]